MTQHLRPPIPPAKPKENSTLAIALAILLHILMAIVIYFTVFDDDSSKRENSERSLTPSVSIATISEDPSAASVEAITPDNQKNTAQSGAEPDQLSSNSTKKTAARDGQIASNNTMTTQTQQSSTQDNDNSEMVQTSVLGSNDNAIATRKPTADTQNDQAEYTLKKTKEYEQLDDDIDKDSEQLSKLITEVRQRNQDQIRQHQIDKPITTNTQSTPMVEPNYPITPINSLATSSSNNSNQ